MLQRPVSERISIVCHPRPGTKSGYRAQRLAAGRKTRRLGAEKTAPSYGTEWSAEVGHMAGKPPPDSGGTTACEHQPPTMDRQMCLTLVHYYGNGHLTWTLS